MVKFSFFLFPVLLLLSCGKKEDDAFGKIPKMPSRFGGHGDAEVKPKEDRYVESGVDPASLSVSQGGVAGLPAQEDIRFLDPDDPEGSEKALAALLSHHSSDWEESHSVAKNRSLVEAKPLLIFFTNTPGPRRNGSASAVSLDKELFRRKDFLEWAGEHFIMLKLDFNVKGRRSVDSEKLALALKKEKYLETLKKRYKVGGTPVVLVVANNGQVTRKLRGYTSGQANYIWGQLRSAVESNKSAQDEFEQKLSKKGYRRWKGKNGQVLLARLVKYEEGELILIGANGERYPTRMKNLSPEDREWVTAEKKKREAARAGS